MLRKYLSKKKPRVFLGSLVVAPRTDIKRHLEDWTWQPQENLGVHLQRSLESIFTLPLVSEDEEPTKQDYVLDVIVQKYQSGDFLYAYGGDVVLPLLWRPKVTVCGRLSNLKTKKIKSTYTVTEKCTWGQYIGSIVQPQALLGIKPAFGTQVIEYLLNQACYKLLVEMRNKNEF